MNILLTGGAGFIGFHTAKALLDRGDSVFIVDNFNDYYDPELKHARAKELIKNPNSQNLRIYKIDISNYHKLTNIFKKHRFNKICHLAAQAGVRYSIQYPLKYEKSNNLGTLNLLELAKDFKIPDFVFASSSSVYGGNKKMPFSENDNVDSPISLYAATKKTNELYTHVYHKLYGLNCTGLRFFTVYGSFGRPDMAYFSFTKKILEGKSVEIYNNGMMQRDFTHVDDIVQGILAAIDKPYNYEIINLGNNKPIQLMKFISIIERELGKKANKKMMSIQPGDVKKTYANISKAKKLLNFKPKTSIEQGIKNFVEWYKNFYKI